jgi:hypothetical protein
MAMVFPGDAANRAIDLGTLSPAFSGAMSITCWHNPNPHAPENNTIVCKGDGIANAAQEWALNYDGTGPPALEVNLNTGAGGINLTGSLSLAPTNIWHFCAMTYDGVNKRVYVNGVLGGTQAQTGNVVSSSKATRIGGVQAAALEREIGGPVDDVRIYDRALSTAEIETMFATLGADGIVHGLLHRWTLREVPPGVVASGAGSTKDLGPSQINGTPVNSPVGAESVLRG